jgi:Fic family protein
MSQLNLFYPQKAGWREPTTSRDNALRIEASGKAKTLRERAKQFFEDGGEATADELSTILGVPFRSGQPRVAELRAQGFIEPTGIRRKGSGGGSSHVWKKSA